MQSWRRWSHALFGGVLLLVLGWAPAAAQSIKGTVTDSANQRPLEGALVSVVGTNKRAMTRANGEYELTDVAAGTLLVRVQMIGYAPAARRLALAAGDDATMDFALVLKPIELEEMVSIGYGTVARDNLSTAVSTVSAEEVNGQANASADAALAGRAPGVQVIQNAGNPGNAISVRVRGTASITANNQPLYVVDGVPVISEDLSQLGVGGQGIRAITGLSAEDIASIDVLKDAASASIYGSRGSNGVVLITTKRGQEGRGTVTFSSYYGSQSVLKKIDLLNGPQYLEYMREAAANDGYDPDDWFPATGANTDWQDEVFRSAPISGAEIAAAGGTDLHGRALVDAHPEEPGPLQDHRQQAVLPLPPQEMLVHDRGGKEPEARHHLDGAPGDLGILVAVVPEAVGAPLVAGEHGIAHDRRPRGGAPHHRPRAVAPLHGGEGRRATEHRHQRHLVAAGEPDPGDALEPGRHGAVGRLRPGQVEDHRVGPELPQLDRLLLARLPRLLAGHRHHRDAGPAAPPGQLHEAGDQRVGLAPAAHDQQVAAGLAGQRGRRGRRHEQEERGRLHPRRASATGTGRSTALAPSCTEMRRAVSTRARCSTVRRSRVSRDACAPRQMAATVRPVWFSIGAPIAA